MADGDAWLARRPAPPLRPIVDRYVGYRVTGGPAGVHRGLPSRHMTFIVGIGAPIEVLAHPDPRQGPASYRCVVGGLQAGPALIASPGEEEGVAVELTPLGSRALFGLPARELWDLSLEVHDVVGAVGDELWERLQGPGSWARRFATCDEVLLGLLRDETIDPTLAASWRTLVASGGTMPVEALARQTGWSRQHLRRRFADELGLGPKLAARVVRFERAHRLLQAEPGRPVAWAAAECGYSDQAHLARDVAELAGCTPRELLADVGRPAELDAPFLQDVEAGPG